MECSRRCLSHIRICIPADSRWCKRSSDKMWFRWFENVIFGEYEKINSLKKNHNYFSRFKFNLVEFLHHKQQESKRFLSRLCVHKEQQGKKKKARSNLISQYLTCRGMQPQLLLPVHKSRCVPHCPVTAVVSEQHSILPQGAVLHRGGNRAETRRDARKMWPKGALFDLKPLYNNGANVQTHRPDLG